MLRSDASRLHQSRRLFLNRAVSLFTPMSLMKRILTIRISEMHSHMRRILMKRKLTMISRMKKRRRKRKKVCSATVKSRFTRRWNRKSPMMKMTITMWKKTKTARKPCLTAMMMVQEVTGKRWILTSSLSTPAVMPMKLTAA